jgi:hypothetical protein
MIRRFALLQTFVAVARAGKMKHAAHELALTPGAVSQHIRQLEEAAGRRLFTRTSTGVELSAAGEAMFGEAPSVDLVLGYHQANTSPLLKLFLSRAGQLVERVSRRFGGSGRFSVADGFNGH